MIQSSECLIWSPGIQNHSGAASHNLGDLIIQESVEYELHKVFGAESQFPKISTHMRLGPAQRKLAKQARNVIVGGSNLLSSYMDGYFQWDLIMSDALRIRRAVLMGAGWWRDQGACNRYTRALLWAVLSWRGWHSVRDSQALQQLRQIGFKRVLNTGCPTMWSLADQKTEAIRTSKGDSLLLMLTDYDRKPELDRQLLELASRNYTRTYLWPQGEGDAAYARELGYTGSIIDRTLSAFDQLLEAEKHLDYLGTRLHGGIRCLKAGKRCLTIEVDNRAREIGKDTDLPTITREDLPGMEQWMNGSKEVHLRLPVSAINQWRSQFGKSLTR